MSARILAHARAQLAQQDIAHAVSQRAAQPLRRAGLHARMALLAGLHVLECEQPQGCDGASDGPVACSTALLWHSLQGPQAETEALLAAQRAGDGLLLPFDFLASQPGLLCAHLQPFIPGLEQAVFLPGTAHPHEQPWMQLLQLADVWLAEGRFQRVLCASLNLGEDGCQYAAISLCADTSAQQAVLAGQPLVRCQWQPQNAVLFSNEHGLDADAALWRMLENPAAQELVLPVFSRPMTQLHLLRMHAGASRSGNLSP